MGALAYSQTVFHKHNVFFVHGTGLPVRVDALTQLPSASVSSFVQPGVPIYHHPMPPVLADMHGTAHALQRRQQARDPHPEGEERRALAELGSLSI